MRRTPINLLRTGRSAIRRAALPTWRSRLAKNEIDGAAEAVGPLLALPVEKRINGIVATAQRVHTALRKASDSKTGTDLQLEIEAFSRSPLAALPR